MALTPGQATLIARIRRMSDAEILREFEDFSRFQLRFIRAHMAPEECDCDLVPVPCECGTLALPMIDCECGVSDEHPAPCPRCGMEPEWRPCEHFKSYYLSDQVLMRLEELLFEQPPLPKKIDKSMTREARAVVLAMRHHAKESLWHPADRAHEDITGEVLDRVERLAWTRSGFKKAGCPKEELDAPPPANGDVVAGKLRKRMAA